MLDYFVHKSFIVKIHSMQSDPKRPNKIHGYAKKGKNQEDDGSTSGVYQLLSLIMGIVAFLFKVTNPFYLFYFSSSCINICKQVKWACWGSLILYIISVVHMKFPSDIKQIITSFGYQFKFFYSFLEWSLSAL